MGTRVTVVGAGIAGLRCAGVLAEAGLEVIVVDKARGPGGRCSTRRHQGFRFDHGAQYFTASSPEFRSQVAAWRERGVADLWSGGIVKIDAGGKVSALTDQPQRYVGVPGMSGIARAMAAGLDCTFVSRVSALRQSSGSWELVTDGGQALRSDLLVLTPPPAQTAELLATVSPHLSGQVRSVVMRPCWALMLGFSNNPVTAFDGAFVADQPVGWMASSAGKTGRDHAGAWIVHGSDDYSERNLERSPEAVTRDLFEAFCAITGQREQPAEMVAHRWRYAKAVEPLNVGTLTDPALGVWVAGDWCSGSRVEGAWLSGQAAADDLLDKIN